MCTIKDNKHWKTIVFWGVIFTLLKTYISIILFFVFTVLVYYNKIISLYTKNKL